MTAIPALNSGTVLRRIVHGAFAQTKPAGKKKHGFAHMPSSSRCLPMDTAPKTVRRSYCPRRYRHQNSEIELPFVGVRSGFLVACGGFGPSTASLANQAPVYCGCPAGTHGDLVSRVRLDQKRQPFCCVVGSHVACCEVFVESRSLRTLVFESPHLSKMQSENNPNSNPTSLNSSRTFFRR